MNIEAPQNSSKDKTFLFTIGFAQKTAREFFETLKKAKVHKIIDIRLNNVSQLAGFTKKEDLEYFLKEIAGIDYIHRPDLAPTKEILDDYKNKKIGWEEYERRFHTLIIDRQIEKKLSFESLISSCLLCSEPKANKCHRRLVAEYLKERLAIDQIMHL